MEFREIVLYASEPIDNSTQLARAIKATAEYARIALRTDRIIRIGAVELKPLKEKDRKALGLDT